MFKWFDELIKEIESKPPSERKSGCIYGSDDEEEWVNFLRNNSDNPVGDINE